MKSPALLCLHGFLGSPSDWAFLENSLAGMSVQKMFLPGHHPNRAVPKNFEAAVQDFGQQIQSQYPEGVHLLGYSMGGRLALGIALAFPESVKSLVLISASPGLKTEAERHSRWQLDQTWAHRLRTETFESVLTDWYTLPLFSRFKTCAEFSDLFQERLSHNPKTLADGLESLSIVHQPNYWKQLDTLACPTLVIVGSEDSKYVQIAKSMACKRPKITLKIISGADHCPQFTHPKAVKGVIERHFLG
ncbi:MAG: 2-succinyl-6-hydroxy-2,4-cyclohexadiene-1-carboxylate synthase [Candidatus Margulisiibacteriota bacterium]